MNLQVAQNGGEAREHIAKPGQAPGCAFRESHSPGMSTGACADAAAFKERYALVGFRVPQPSGGGESGKAAANNGEFYFLRQRLLPGMDINSPGWESPSRYSCRVWRECRSHICVTVRLRFLLFSLKAAAQGFERGVQTLPLFPEVLP